MATDQKIVIKADNLHKTFHVKAVDVPVLEKITLQINQGEFVIITGPSGCGKSTLLHVLLGLEEPSGGKISFLGKFIYSDFSEDERTEFRKRHVGMVYQQPNWIRALTVVENVMFALRINGADVLEAREKALATLKMVGMDEWQDYLPTELSSGQQQKVAIARAVVTNPDVIIADEPTGNLDFQSGQELMKLLSRLNDEGKTVIMVTHDLEYLPHASRSLIMFDGVIKGEANKEELKKKQNVFNKLIEAMGRTAQAVE